MIPIHMEPQGALAAISAIRKAFPAIPVEDADERFTSKMAKDAMLQMGLKKGPQG